VNIQSLSVSERIVLAEALWDSVVEEDADIELTETQKKVLDARLAAFEKDGDIGASWSSVKSRILSNR
jgi:putative addiction module component (TIGR02574 family)